MDRKDTQARSGVIRNAIIYVTIICAAVALAIFFYVQDQKIKQAVDIMDRVLQEMETPDDSESADVP